MVIVIPIRNQNSSGALSLPQEIWDSICALLLKPSLSRLRLVSSGFDRIALPWVYRNLRLEGFGNSAERFIQIDKKSEHPWQEYTRKRADPEDDLGVPFDQVIQLKELTVTNLADFYDTDLVASGALKKVMSLPSLTDLKLLIATEIDESMHESPVFYEEKYAFFDHLPETWLAPSVSDNLRVLSLYYNEYWGWLPKMDFRGMAFPRLKVLALGQYVFSHDWQIDWIASIGQENGSGGLEELYLDDCPIMFQALQASPLDEKDPGYPLLSAILDGAVEDLFKYPMRWHHVLPRWATALKALRVFRMGHGSSHSAPEDTFKSVLQEFRDVDEDVLRYRLSQNSHRSFACPGPLVSDCDGVEDPFKVWESGKYVNGAGINGSGAYKLQYIEYENISSSPWMETFWDHVDDDQGYEPEEGTWVKDLATFEAFCSAVEARR